MRGTLAGLVGTEGGTCTGLAEATGEDNGAGLVVTAGETGAHEEKNTRMEKMLTVTMQ